MQRLKRLVPIAAVLTLVAAPAAIAPAYAQGQQQQQQAQHMMGATSSSHLLDHAYQEALHAHEAAALGMNDMATNHLENVRLTVAMIDPQRIGMSRDLQQQLAAIRETVENVDLPGEPAQAVQNTQRVVSQFIAFYNRVPQGGGGGAAQQAAMMPTAFDLTAMASTDAAAAQTSVMHRDWNKVQRHAQDAVTHIDQAIKAAETGTRKLDAKLVTELRNIRQDANQLLTHARNKNQAANQTAGKLVGRLGTVSPKIATALESKQGGGAGQQKRAH
jgi:hypothetical protein